MSDKSTLFAEIFEAINSFLPTSILRLSKLSSSLSAAKPFLYKLFLEYRGRIPFNNANLAQTSCSEVEFCFNGKSLRLYLDILVTATNERFKKTHLIIIKKLDAKKILEFCGSEATSDVLKEEYLLGDETAIIQLSGKNKILLKRSGGRKVQCSLER